MTFAGFPTDASVAELARANEKVLKAVMADLHTGADGVAMYRDVAFNTSAGTVRVDSLSDKPIR